MNSDGTRNTPGTLRVMLLPFVLTVLVGGAVLVLVLSMIGVLPLNVGGLFSVREAAVDPAPQATNVPNAIEAGDLQSTATPLPAIADATLVCETNARRFALGHPDGSTVANASRLLMVPGNEVIYVIADGRLARVPLELADQEEDTLEMVQTEPSNRMAGEFPLQELIDMDYDSENDALLVLDKSGRVFGYRPGGQWALVRQPDQAPDGEADPSYLGLAVDGGEVYLLDADLNQVWHFETSEGQHSTPARLFPSAQRLGGNVVGLDNTVDLLVSGSFLLTLDTDGILHRYDSGDRRPTLDVAVGGTLPLSLQSYDGQVYAVDGLQRTLAAINSDGSEPGDSFRFALPEMGLLRDALLDGEGRLWGVADNTLIVHPLGAEGDCPAPDRTGTPMVYYDVDLSTALADFRYPLDDAYLPLVPRAYPGARRLYRAGVHQGLDVYPWDVEDEFDIGEPVRAMQDGVVIRADVDYDPVSNREFNRLTDEALALGVSLPETLDRIGGRQVHIAHEGGITTRYLHLDSVAEDVTMGVEVERGQIIGGVGVSGTGREADEVFVVAHLHAEIWIGDHYLGHGLSLRETMWLWEQIFPDLGDKDPA